MSESMPADPVGLDLLGPYCETVAFGAGDVLREKGQHYRNLYMITGGQVGVRLSDDGDANGVIELGPGAVIGEIGFLHGCPATAHVVANETSHALVIDDRTIRRIEKKNPNLAVRLLRFLATTSEQRTVENSAILDMTRGTGKNANLEVLLCRNDAMLESALRLRYEVYCGELGRESPYADHGKKIIKDDLDDFVHAFIVVADGETVGTLRCNLAREGDLGILETLYGMRDSPHHPDKTCICTKFIVKRSHRGSAVAMKMLSAATRYMIRSDMRECYGDCIPALLHYYKSFGFRVAAPVFLHYENGPSYPLKLGVKHARRLCNEIGTLQSLEIYLRAQMYRWLDRPRNRP